MAFKTHYHEALQFYTDLLANVFTRLQAECAAEIAAVRSQFPSTDLLVNPVIIPYPEAVALLRAAGNEMGDFEDLSTELERKLGQLVREKYNTDFFVLDKFPIDVRPVYTMPDAADPRYSTAYDMFLRGEEIVSGSQRVHDAGLLLQRAAAKGIDLGPVQGYVDCFKYGAPPHAGIGCGLDRVTFLFLGLKNVRRGSLFPRDPRRLTP
jgi:aspartyl-tRNA synthetase